MGKRVGHFVIFLILLSSLLIKPCEATYFGEPPRPGLHEYEHKKGTYLVYYPPGYNPNLRYPVVVISYINFEGENEIESSELLSRWSRLSNERGYVVVLPLGGGVITRVDEWFRDLLKYLKVQYGLKRSRTLITGFGTGGHYALHLGLSYPKEFGLVSAVASSFEGPWEKMLFFKRGERAEFYLISGDQDSKTPIEKARKAAETLKAKGYSVQLEELKGVDHRYSEEIARKIADWFDDRLKENR
jgi:predicted esterase